MRDISTIVKSYYDTAVVPVTAAEAIAHTAVDDDRRSVPNWAFAVAAATIVIVLLGGLSFLLGGSDEFVEPAGPGLETTVPTPVDNIAAAILVTPPIDVEWTLEATLDDWLTEPVLVNGEILAIRKGIEGEGLAEGVIETTGELWKSSDGVTWFHVEDSDELATPPTRYSTSGGAVVVEYHVDPMSYDSTSGVADGLVATGDGSTWREINLRPFQDDWIPRVADGVLGWFVYSPPRANTESSSIPRSSNLGLWYTPDTEVWFEATNLGPLDSLGDVGTVGVMDMAIVVRDDDAFVFAHTAENVGFGVFGQPKTEIWRLELANYPNEGSLTTTSMTVSGEWNPILATTEASQTPPAATCPAGSDPNSLGPIAQNRPRLAGYTSNQSAVFDRRAGKVIHIDGMGETWAFDVCTNTWDQLHPEVDTRGLTVGVSLSGGELVYDADSDATLLFRKGVVLVYDTAGNTWVVQQAPAKTYDILYPGLGAIYDPISGLVVLQTAAHGIIAYDVDTNAWTEIGTLAGNYPDFLIGYSAVGDRLYFLAFQNDGVAVDPRTGDTVSLRAPVGGVAGGFGAFEYAASTDTAFVFADGVCRLDPTSLNWTCTGKPDIPRPVQNFESMVGDPINNRLILFRGSCCGLYPTMHDDVWALDFDTGTWSLLLEDVNQRLHE